MSSAAAARADIDKLAPHDLRRTCARLCHLAGGELDQIQFLLGHVSIQTMLALPVTEYCDDSLRSARPELADDATPVARLDHRGVLVRHQQFWPVFQKTACLPMRLVERAWQALSVFFPGRVQSIAVSEPRKVLHRRDVLRIEWASPLKMTVDDGRCAGPEIFDGENWQ